MPLDADIIKEEDTYRWEPTLENPRTGATYDLTNASEVRLYVDHLRSDTLVVNSAVEIVDAANGEVAYDFSQEETARAGTHRAEFVVQESDGDVVTVPADGYVKLDFTPMLPRGADLEPATADTDATVATLTATDWIESPTARLGSATIDDIETANQPTGPDGSYVGQRGGIETTIAPSVTLYETQAEPFKKVVYQDGTTFYAVSQDTTGTVYKSTDSGASWSNQGDVGASSQIETIQRIEATGTLIAFDEGGGVHRSTDDGVTWTTGVHTLAYPPIEAQGVTDTPSGNIAVGEYGNDGNTVYEIYLSTDDGSSWSSVLQSDGSSPAANPGHVQSLQYDPNDGKLVAMLDYPSPEIHVSDDEGATWSLLATADTDKKPNYVSLMFFTNYIAWGYDSHPENGWIRRMDRTDFYGGSWTDDMVEDVAKVNDKMCYYSLPIQSDMWLTAWASESNEHPGSYAQEHYLVYDDGSKVTGAFEHASPTADINSTLGHKTRFPGYPHDSTDLGSQTWVNLSTASLPKGSSAVPISVGENSSLPRTTLGFVSNPILPNNTSLSAKDTSGGVRPLIQLSASDRLKIPIPLASAGTEIRGYSSGRFAFLHGGLISMSISDGEVHLRESDVTNFPKYSDDSNAPSDSLYYDTTDAQLEYKDDGGTIHPLG